MEIYFIFSFPPQKKKKETQPTLHTLPKPHEPTLKPNLCQRVQSCLHAVGIDRTFTHTIMKEYINQIFKFLIQIVQKKRIRNRNKSNSTTTDFEVTTIEIESHEISSLPNSNFQEEIESIEKNRAPITVSEKPTTGPEKNINEESLNGLTLQNKYDNDVTTDTVIDEPESKNDTEDRVVEPEIIDEDDLKEINKTSIEEISDSETTDRIKSTSIKRDSSPNENAHKRKPQDISNETDAEDKQVSATSKKRRIPCKNVLKKDTDELLQRINRIFDEHKLIGNFDVTEDEYSELLENAGLLCNSLLYYGNVFEDKHHKLIFTTLVEIAKRWKDSDNEDDAEENSRFWDYISKHLVNEDSINPKLYHAFTNVISQLKIDHSLPIVTTGKKYYSTLMMHSFAPKYSIFSFFDLCYNIFKKDLDFGFTNDDEWLCEIVAEQMKTVLGGGYREDKKVSIGSSAYSIKIGLRSYSQNEDLFADFIQFIKDRFYEINKLFNREPINENTRLEHYIVEWWKNKTESEKVSADTTRKRRVPTVSKENIVAKYIRDENSVFLYIPSIRMDDGSSTVSLKVFVNGEQIRSEEIRTKRGELVFTTKQIEMELNDLLSYYDTINLSVEIKENHTVIFDSERNKATSLNREFILFEGEKEVLSQINKPTNYFVYSKDIDALRRKPDELTTYGTNLYNIYPRAGESLTGEIKQVFFVDKTKTASMGKTPCLIGSVQNAEWFFDDISCIVYSSGVKLLVPQNANLKALELRIDKKAYKLHELNFERIESGCYQFGLKAIGLIPENHPTEIILYSYEKESTILSETIIVLPKLEMQFNHPFYYGDIERKLTVLTGDEAIELTWSNQDNEIRCPLNNGMLLIKIAYLRWRINSNKWHNEPINRKLWYKDFLANGDILEIDNPKENYDITIFGKSNGEPFEIFKNQTGNFEIGRAIYTNENKTDINVYIVFGKDIFEIFNVSTKEHFISNPLTYTDGKVFWNVEDTFIGDKSNEFFLIIKSADNNFRSKINYKNSEIGILHEDICKIQVKVKDKNIFSKAEKYHLIHEGELLIGSPDKLRFKYKKIWLLSANCFDSNKSEWIHFIPKYFIDKLKFVQEDENIYYAGQLCVIDKNGDTEVLSTMINEKGAYDKTNPVRIEFRDNSTLWLVAGWEGGKDFIGNLFCDKWSKSICNIQKQDNQFDEINLYKYQEEEDV